MAEILISYFGLAIAIASILLVVWDHFKDDRLLTKRVQSFYEDIENLIYSFFKKRIVEDLWLENAEVKKYEEEFAKFEKKHLFYWGRFHQYIEEYSNYLGLTRYRGDQIYMNGTDFMLERSGDIFNFVSNIKSTPKLNRNRTFWDNNTKNYILNENAITIINEFFETLRNYWKEHHYKKIFRKKLKSKLDFLELLTNYSS